MATVFDFTNCAAAIETLIVARTTNVRIRMFLLLWLRKTEPDRCEVMVLDGLSEPIFLGCTFW